MTESKIEWTGKTWNPVTGCTKISPGCKYCYAEKMSRRLRSMGVDNYRNGFQVTTHKHMLTRPLSWKKPSLIFVNSMSDLFHQEVPDHFIKDVFDIMTAAHWHQYQVLTKIPERLLKLASTLSWQENVWMGTSVENKKYLHRIDTLRKSGAKTKFLSLEPLLGSLGELNLDGIDWVIVGGESGFRARPMVQEWVEEIQVQCQNNQVPFFFKQWGGKNKKRAGRILNGKVWDEMPLIYKPIHRKVS